MKTPQSTGILFKLKLQCDLSLWDAVKIRIAGRPVKELVDCIIDKIRKEDTE